MTNLRGNEEHNMKKKWMFLLVPPAIVLFVFVGGEVVMHLWNWLLPALFGWRQVTFWQAVGLLALCRILFGGLGSHNNHRFKGQPTAERWARMTPEEHQKFRQNMGSRCGGFGAASGETSEPA